MTTLLMAFQLAVPAMLPLAPTVDTTSDARTPRGGNVLATATRYLGVRYRFGGTTPKAFDCSGFVRHVFRPHGIELPRVAREQIAAGVPVIGGLDSVRVGDLLFFRTRRGRAGHVAIYAGNGRIIHASAGSRRVRYDDLSSRRGRWFVTRLTAVRRVLVDEPPAGIAEESAPTGADPRQ